MDLKSVSSTRIYVTDLDASCVFYEKLGFRAGKRDEDRAIYYLNWYSVELVKTRAGEIDNTKAGMVMSMKVNDIHAAYDYVRSAGFEPTGEPAKSGNGTTEFEIRDPDGNRLVFFDK